MARAQILPTIAPPGGSVPPGGREAPGGDVPPGGRQAPSAPGGGVPHVSVGRHTGGGRLGLPGGRRGPLARTKKQAPVVVVNQKGVGRNQARQAILQNIRGGQGGQQAQAGGGQAAGGKQLPNFTNMGRGPRKAPIKNRVKGLGQAAAQAQAGNPPNPAPNPAAQGGGAPMPPPQVPKAKRKKAAKAKVAQQLQRAPTTQPMQAQAQQDVDEAEARDEQIRQQMAKRNAQWAQIHQQLNQLNQPAVPPPTPPGLPAPGGNP